MTDVGEIASRHFWRRMARAEAHRLNEMFQLRRYRPERAGGIRARWVVRRLK